jgi:hypothetical protein
VPRPALHETGRGADIAAQENRHPTVLTFCGAGQDEQVADTKTDIYNTLVFSCNLGGDLE